MTPASMRRTFLLSALGVAAATTAFAGYFTSLRCQAATAAPDCRTFDFSQTNSGEFYLLVGLPATIIVPLLVLAWLMGRTPPGAQNSDS